ncbi:MAG: peptidylprolyl isomerase [Alphaproteobacteria bacterium]|jgi:peptidyl-prolyl cis-trans isomerase SurA
MVHLIRLRHGVRVLATAVILTALTIAAAPAQAQEMQRIAAVVNDEAISFFDVFERVKLVVATSGLDGSPGVIQRITPQVLRALIDEHLRLQEGVRRNIDVSEDEIDRAINTIEQDNRMPSGSFLKFLEENRISVETLETRVRSELVWSKLVNRRVRRSVTISDEDIDNELELMRDNVGKPEYLLSEIFISVDKPSEDKRVRGDATELVAQLRGGADFDSMVNQFSEGVTANRGGGVGWVNAAQLSPNIVSVITTMATGDISDPIATGGGYLIVLLRDRRQLQGAGADDTQVDLRQILLTLPPDSTQDDVDAAIGLAAVIRESVSGCDDMVRIAAETDPSLPGDMGIIRIKNTPEPIKVVLRSLPLTTVSQPIRTKRGIHLLMICDKIEVEASLPGRDQIRNSLLINRLGQVSRQYLRDLRRDAFIDIRI